MNRDYAYCVGVNFFKEKAPALCKNCKRYIPWSEPVEDTLIWVAPQYDVNTGSTGTSGYECSCDSLQFKQACYNCWFNKCGSCTNTEVMEEYRKKINADMPFNMKIKHPERSCGHWDVSGFVIYKLFKPQK